jgi:hypothetical protein
MTKFKMLVVFAVSFMMVPFSAFSMDIISDGEMEAVIGQAGVSIGFTDISLDVDILNFAWGDTDCGTLILSTLRHSYTPGYVNVNNIQMDNIYIDLDTDTIGIATDMAGGTYLSNPAQPITIDVMTFSSNGPHCPTQYLRGKTAVVIGMPDMYIAVEEITIDGIYLDDRAYTSVATKFTSTQKWTYTTGPLDNRKNLGTMTISGIQLTTHAYVGGYETLNTVPGGELKPIHPNHRAMIIITTH